MSSQERLVVIGGNAAGMAAALRARRRRPDLDITVIEQSQRIATANCSIPAYLEGKIENIATLEQLTPQKAAAEHNLNLLTEHRAITISPQKHFVTLENLSTKQTFNLPFHRLILALGASPMRPSLPNVHAKGVFTLRSLDDALTLRSYLEIERPKHFIVLGTGTIAQICAAALRSYGIEILIIGPEPRLMADLEKPISERIIATLAAGGVRLYNDENTTNIKVSLEGKIEALETATRSFPCRGLLIAIGVQPNVDLAQNAGIALDDNGSIRVDRRLMTNRQGIYAYGDCAQTFNRITHKPFYWTLATTANRQGRIAGENASGGNDQDLGNFGARLWTCFDLQIGRVGISSGQAQAAGFKAKVTSVKARSKPSLYGGAELDLTLISDSSNGCLLGAQIAGTEGVHARLNTLIAALAGHLTLSDLESLDLAYTPAISSLWDPVQIAGRLGVRELK